jgi:hypothetical protein
MKYRRFGRTEIQISEIAFGGGRSGGILIDADDETRRRAVRAALDHGINWFDTAPYQKLLFFPPKSSSPMSITTTLHAPWNAVLRRALRG